MPRIQQGDFEGRHSESIQFGGCYLGRHLGEINQIQQRYVEEELVEYEINRHLGESDNPVDLPDDQREDTIAELMKSFNNEGAFKEMDDGKFSVALDGEAVREAARTLIAK